jgi:hypothetical protein
MLTNPPPSSAENKNGRNYTAIIHIRLHGVQWDNFNLVYIMRNLYKILQSSTKEYNSLK